MTPKERAWSIVIDSILKSHAIKIIEQAIIKAMKKEHQVCVEIARKYVNLYSNEPNHISQRTADVIAQAIEARGKKT